MKNEKRWATIGVCLLLPWPWVWLVGLWSLYGLIRKGAFNGKAPTRKLVLNGAIFVAAGIAMSAQANKSFFDAIKLGAGSLAVLYGAGLAAFGVLTERRRRKSIKYASVIGNRKAVRIEEIASALPVSFERACKDLQRMIDRGELAEGAYIDYGLRHIVFEREAIIEVTEDDQAYIERRVYEVNIEPDNYADKLAEIRNVKRGIKSESVYGLTDRIEALTASVFRAVEDDAGKRPQIQKFMNYYLPTTLKLLRQYSALERQSLGGANVRKTKRDIEGVLEKVVQGFESQLDILFSADAMDVNADIAVLEAMMAKDGLTRNDYVFGTFDKAE